jgi:methionine--tRNA ligase beta chain
MDMISFDDFAKLDIRIGTVTKAEVPEWSHWVIKLTVDFGEFGDRTIFAGMMKFYKPDEFEGKQFPFVLNIAPKKIGPAGDFSQGMMLAADNVLDKEKPEEGVPILLRLQKKVPNGTKVR